MAAAFSNFPQFVSFLLGIVRSLTQLVAALALLAFFWGLVKFIAAVGGDEKAVSEGKNLMVWGVLGLFVMVSVWGILSFLTHEFGFGFVLPLLPTN